jgi:hypothetical protein
MDGHNLKEKVSNIMYTSNNDGKKLHGKGYQILDYIY